MRTTASPLVVAAVAVAVACTLAAPAAGADTVGYQAPVDAPVVDPFRPPTNPYGPGNRGLEYATTAGSPVRAAAAGAVHFAGAVGGDLHVTVGHADGRRTTYAFLASIAVHAGERVERGAAVGTSGDRLHFGVREGDVYVDPAPLLSTSQARVHLVPHRSGGGAVAAPPTTLYDAGEVEVTAEDVAWAAAVVGRPPERCTPASVAAPAVRTRRIAVLVGGLGSTSGRASVDGLDTHALGYAVGDVVRFSYAGGRVPDATDGPDMAAVAARPYTAADTAADMTVAGRRLAELLAAVAASIPGVPIDLVAHSQGGVVARLALAALVPRAGTTAAVETLVTLGTPHRGADLATVARNLGPAVPGAGGLDAVSWLAGVDAGAPALAQLAPGSDLLRRLADQAPPPTTRVLSIGARTDVVVAAPRTRWAGQRSVVVDVDRVHAHDGLPSSPAATRELALARAGWPPTCESIGGRAADAVVGRLVQGAEWLAGAVLGLVGVGP